VVVPLVLLVLLVLAEVLDLQLVDGRRITRLAIRRLATGTLELAGTSGDRHLERSRVVQALDLDQPLKCDLSLSQAEGAHAMERHGGVGRRGLDNGADDAALADLAAPFEQRLREHELVTERRSLSGGELELNLFGG
jgi:hypothetical protein